MGIFGQTLIKVLILEIRVILGGMTPTPQKLGPENCHYLQF